MQRRISANRGATEKELHASKPDASAGDIGNADRNAKKVCEENNLACLNEARSVAKPRGVAPRAANDGHPLARLPLGRSDVFGETNVTPPLAQGLPKLSPEDTTAGTFQQDGLRTGQIQPPSRARSHRRARVRALGDWGHPTAIVRVRTVEMSGPVAMKGVEL